jgi:hypothetical protein
LAVLVLVTLPILLPQHLTLGPGWLLAVVGGLAVLFLLVVADEPGTPRALVRWLGLGLTTILIIATTWITERLLYDLITGGKATSSAGVLLSSGALVWLANTILFGLLFWELDGGGPARRSAASPRPRDFAFPQELSPEIKPPGWRPVFVDYLYVGVTNGVAFSPTDAMPLTPRAKMIMALEAGVSFLVLGLVVARAVNVLT